MKNKNIIVLIVAALCIVIGYIVFTTIQQGKLDALAQCLTEKKVVMYGAEWCSHCAQQKEEFGSSFKHITYYSCAETAEDKDPKCIDLKIVKYPTWIMDDKRMEGFYKPTTLAKEFGCEN